MKPRLSASLILCRESLTSPFEVLMIRRKQNLHFSNAFVFPGGSLDPPDTDPFWLSQTSSSRELIRPTPYSPEIDLTSLRITAIRETWEETGVLLSNKKIPPNSDFLQSCQTQKIIPSIEKLHYLTRIIAPTTEKKRFDTTFFISIEGSQSIQIDNQESDFFHWGSPKSFLDEFFEGKITLWPPQIYILKTLSDLASLTQVFWVTSEIEKTPLLFQIVSWEQGSLLSVLPGDYRHDFTPEELKAMKSENFLRLGEGKVHIFRSPAAQEYLLSLIR